MTNTTFSDYKVKGQGQGHRRGQNHIFGNNFACNEDRNMKLTLFFFPLLKAIQMNSICYDVLLKDVRQNDVRR